MNNNEYIENYLKETCEIVSHIDKNEIDKFINILFNAWKRRKKVITMGNGGSASTASHFAADLSKTVVNPSSETDITGNQGFRALCLNDNPSALTAWVNDCGWDKVYAGFLNTYLDEEDVILLISVHGGSGWSSNIIQAIDVARKRNAKILGLSGFDGGKLKELADSCIVVPKNSTPHTEGFHVVLQHLIVDRLMNLVQESQQLPYSERFPDVGEIETETTKNFLTQIIQENNKAKK